MTWQAGWSGGRGEGGERRAKVMRLEEKDGEEKKDGETDGEIDRYTTGRERQRDRNEITARNRSRNIDRGCWLVEMLRIRIKLSYTRDRSRHSQAEIEQG